MVASHFGSRGTVAPHATQPISQHCFRAFRRHAKRIEQQERIKELEAELQVWWAWWYQGSSAASSAIDGEVLLRLRALEPGLRAQVTAQFRGVPRHSDRLLVPQDIHVHGNAARHYFPDKSFGAVTVAEVRKHQRVRENPGGPSRDGCAETDDIFGYLSGMASQRCISRCGATILSPNAAEEDEWEGDSLHNQKLLSRQVTELDVKLTRYRSIHEEVIPEIKIGNVYMAKRHDGSPLFYQISRYHARCGWRMVSIEQNDDDERFIPFNYRDDQKGCFYRGDDLVRRIKDGELTEVLEPKYISGNG